MRNKVIKSAIVIYTTLAVVLGICQYLGIPNLDIMSIQDRAVVAIILCAIAAMIGGFHYYLAATWSQ